MRLVLIGALLAAVNVTALAQNTCGAAGARLQHYVQQGNSVASVEYNRNIPMRCGGNPNCMQYGLMQLNQWYSQQTQMVQTWYSQITQQCNQNQPQRRGPRNRSGRDEAPELDVEDLEVDDQDKSVRIRIPSNPRGYR